MGRGESNTNSSAVAMAGRYDLMPPPESELNAYGKPWADHIADVKAARLAMINMLDALDPVGLDTDELRMRASSSGANEDEIVMAQVQLIRQQVIEKDVEAKWHLCSSRSRVERWRALSS